MSKLVISLSGSHIVDDETKESPVAIKKPKAQALTGYFGVWAIDESNEPLALFPVEKEELARKFVSYMKELGTNVVTSIIELPKAKLVSRDFIKSLRLSLEDE